MINVKTVSICKTEYFPSDTKCAPYQKIKANISLNIRDSIPLEKYPTPSRMPNADPIQNTLRDAIDRAATTSLKNFASKYCCNPNPTTALMFLVASCNTIVDLSTCFATFL